MTKIEDNFSRTAWDSFFSGHLFSEIVEAMLTSDEPEIIRGFAESNVSSNIDCFNCLCDFVRERTSVRAHREVGVIRLPPLLLLVVIPTRHCAHSACSSRQSAQR